ncbi:MAG TPA: hypothetical protein VEC14_08820, partial [Reyranellaceae bacterium]|nr:hypothetical protein [Reyranellaceae bacterium]
APLSEEKRTRFISQLRDGAEKAFLDAYGAGVAELAGLDNSDLLALFVIDKAAYEIVYEANNRPAWLSIPLQGLCRLVTRLVGDGKK